MGLINILSIVLIALATTATCQVVNPEGDARIKEFKYLVYIDVEFMRLINSENIPIRDYWSFYGGGVIVSEQWILTCAHIFDIKKIDDGDYFSAQAVTVLAGTKNKSVKTFAQEKNVSIDNVIIHEDWRNPDLLTDIALIFLGEKALSFDKRVQPANLIRSGWKLRLHSKCSIVGWGAHINNGGEEVVPEAARKGSVYVVKSSNCERCINERCTDKVFDDKYHICFGCKGCEDCSMGSSGDSGGPVVQQIGKHEIVVGLTSVLTDSITRRCGKNRPGAAVKISAFRGWIKKKMEEREESYGDERVQRNMAAAVASVAAAYFIVRMFR